MIDEIRGFLADYYMELKFIHLLAVMVWVWSTSVAYAYYLVPVFKAWRRNPDDPEIRALRNWVMERFDQGAIYEHIAFPIVIITGPLLYFSGGWDTTSGWLLLKILIVAGIFVPIEICDYYLSHFGGNKGHVRATGSDEDYEKAVHTHWWFFLITSPAVMIFGLAIIFLAVTKPVF